MNKISIMTSSSKSKIWSKNYKMGSQRITKSSQIWTLNFDTHLKLLTVYELVFDDVQKLGNLHYQNAQLFQM